MQINRLTLVKGILSISALTIMTGCVDDKYDLSDLDTTSKFTVNNLTIPVELETIKLENVIDIADDDPTIKKDTLNKGTANEKVIYSIEKGGNIEPTSFSLGSVNVAQVPINSVEVNVNIPSYIQTGIILPVPIKDQTLDLNLIDKDGVNKGLQSYNFNLKNVDKALVSLDQIETTTISIDVELSIPDGLMIGDNKISFTDIAIKLPEGLIGVTDNANGKYFADKDSLAINNLPVDKTTGKAHLTITAKGLNLGERGLIKKDEQGNHYLDISGEIGLESAKILLNVSQIVIPNPFKIDIKYSVSGFSVENFSGKIKYDMDDIEINPISLNDLPDFLDSPETSIVIDDPVILVTLVNPVGKYGLTGHGTLNITSNFNSESNQNIEPNAYHAPFTLSGNESKLAFCTKDKGTSIPNGYTKIEIEGLDRILTSGNNGLPKTIDVSVSDLIFDGTVTKLPLDNIGDASGDYSFYAPLALGKDTRIVYNTTETGWGSEDLDKVNIYLINLSAVCTTNLPVDASIKIYPIDKNGNIIEVQENKALEIKANQNGQPIGLTIRGKEVNGKIQPIKDFDGIKIEAIVTQDSENAEALGPNLEISLSKVQATVSGDYITDF